jgi:hypothetical protein
MNDLRRACERKPPLSRQACSVFWTLGGNQVGRAALAGWQDLLRPGLRMSPPVALWPFHGDLTGLLVTGRPVVAETYPAEFYAHLGLPRFAKTTRAGRLGCIPALEATALRVGASLTTDVRTALASGFRSDDEFDAFAGALGMLNVLAGHRPADPPHDDRVARTVEGWILGAG